jgi:hypothetical protein
MMFEMPQHEFRFHGKSDWEEISELELIDGLSEIYKMVTPAIEVMIMGKELKTPHAVYRLKLKGGKKSETSTTGIPARISEMNFPHVNRWNRW